MHVIHARNVAEALPAGLVYLLEHGSTEQSRAGDVIVAPSPVTTVYSHPWERVLLSPVRDANPFFHLMEGLWVLAGRRDAAFLDNYVRDYSARFAEPDGRIHDAYGWRMRHALGVDQLNEVVVRLSHDPHDRQCVLQLWDAGIDGCDDLDPTWRTRPCNTTIYLRVRQEVEVVGASPAHGMGGAHQEQVPKLNITVCCRSNDIIWGAYGANAVQFSMLQEYLAARIGVGIGTYCQVSNNYHAYVGELERLCKRTGGCPLHELPANLDQPPWPGLYTAPLVYVSDCFDEELQLLMRALDDLHAADLDMMWEIQKAGAPDRRNWLLSQVAWPAAIAMRLHRLGATAAAIECARTIIDPAWRQACTEWLQRRTS